MIALFYIHMVTAVAAVLTFVLVGIGFGPYLQFHFRDKQSRMGLFIASVCLFAWSRIFFWGILRPVLGEAGLMPEVSYRASTLVVNTGFNLIALFAALSALAALHMSLPQAARERYNWITAPFYPRRILTLWRL